ncbi:MAG: DEAD/DEAH box helicase [Chloroflexi bacterium]|nr:DEAD/DEAH box helicase [Chloroflexota bacterium]
MRLLSDPPRPSRGVGLVRARVRGADGRPGAAWPVVAAGRDLLLAAPTGSGKTLAAFLATLDRLRREPRDEAGVRVLYVSPLKA